MARPKKSDPVDLTEKVNLTAGILERLACPEGRQQAFLRDSHTPGLRVRVTAAGAKAFVYEAKLNRQTIRRTIGDVKSWSIEQARAEARRLAVTLDRGHDPRELERAQREASERAKQEKRQAEEFTLAALVRDYADQLQRLGRSSHDKVRGLMRLHLVEAAPRLAASPAKDVTGEQIADLLRLLNDAGKTRTAGKLRAYLRAAYQMASAAKLDARLPVRFKAYGVTRNPVAETGAIAQHTAKSPLDEDELRQYWQAIKDVPTFEAAALRLHLLTGTQRLEQLCRLRHDHIRPGFILLYDGKGRPGKPPRPHPVPLTSQVQKALEDVLTLAPSGRKMRGRKVAAEPGTFVLSKDDGRTGVTANALGKWAKAAGQEIANFCPKRLRSGVETALAARGVSKSDRGHLLSHGVGGVQSASYDGHDYMSVKRAALETLQRFLEPVGADVISLPISRAA